MDQDRDGRSKNSKQQLTTSSNDESSFQEGHHFMSFMPPLIYNTGQEEPDFKSNRKDPIKVEMSSNSEIAYKDLIQLRANL